MTISYVDQGGAVAVTTATAPAYPTTVVAGDYLILHVSSDASGIGTPGGSWTELGTKQNAGGLFVRTFYLVAVGGETGTVTISVTSGTKGVAWISRYRSSTVAPISSVFVGYGLDTDNTSTAFSGATASFTTATDDVITESIVSLAPSGSYTASNISPNVTQSGASLSFTSSFAGRAATNTIVYQHGRASVTTGATAAIVCTGNATGANATGVALVVVLRENVAQNYTPNQDDSVGVTDLTAVDRTVPYDNAINVSDVLVAAKDIVRLIADSIGVTDTGAPQTIDFGLVYNDNVGILDTTTDDKGSVYNDSTGITDSLVVNLSSGNSPSVSDVIGVTDNRVIVLDKVISISESIGVLDSTTRNSAINITDSIAVTDNAARTIVQFITLVDAVGVRDFLDNGMPLTSGSITDIEQARLAGLGYTGSLSDMRRQWFLAQLLLTEPQTLTLHDLEYRYLGFLGYTGSLADRRSQSSSPKLP